MIDPSLYTKVDWMKITVDEFNQLCKDTPGFEEWYTGPDGGGCLLSTKLHALAAYRAGMLHVRREHNG